MSAAEGENLHLRLEILRYAQDDEALKGFPQKSGHRDKRKWCIIALPEGNYGKAPKTVHN